MKDLVGKVLDAIEDGRFGRLPGIEEGDDLEVMDMLAAVGFRLADRRPRPYVDTTVGREIIELLERMNAGGLTLLIVTHDPAIAAGIIREKGGRKHVEPVTS